MSVTAEPRSPHLVMECPARRCLRRHRSGRGGTSPRARLRGRLGAGSSGGTVRSDCHRHRRSLAGRHAGADQRPHGTDDPGRRCDGGGAHPSFRRGGPFLAGGGVSPRGAVAARPGRFCRMGVYIRYVPYPVISGFMSGIGVIIIVQQVFPFLGLTPPASDPWSILRQLHLIRGNTSTRAQSPSPRRRWRWSTSCPGSPRRSQPRWWPW